MAGSKIETMDFFRLNGRLVISGTDNGLGNLQVASPVYITSLPNFASDAAAQAGGVAIGQLYRNGSVVQVRVT